MWSARSGFHTRPRPAGGFETPRTNDIDVDERRKTIAALRGEETKLAVEGGLTNTEAPHWWPGEVPAGGHVEVRLVWGSAVSRPG